MCLTAMVPHNHPLSIIPSTEILETWYQTKKKKEFYNEYKLYMLMQSCKNTILKMERMSSEKMFLDVNLLCEY